MPNEIVKDQIPLGFSLRYTLQGHTAAITRIAWSPDGYLLASPSVDKTIRLWDIHTGQLLQILTGHFDRVNSVAWSPNRSVLASSSFDGTIRLWETKTGQLLQTLTGHSSWVNSVGWSPNERVLASGSEDGTIRLWDAQSGQPLRAPSEKFIYVNNLAWSPDGQVFATGSGDATVRLWDAQTGQLLQLLRGHARPVFGVAWSPTERNLLASSSNDSTIRLWETKTGREVGVLEGHTAGVTSISFSIDGRLLASKSHDGTIRIWRTSTWETVAILTEVSSGHNTPSLAFCPTTPVLATLGEEDMVIRVWDLDFATLLSLPPITPSVHYANAKVVLVGDSGVGKSGLGLALTEQPFVPTESTHGRNVWTFNSKRVTLKDGRKETREILLWDLAGQPSYRLIHQLHLNEVAVALVVFDAHSETDPFAGISHWVRALHTAQHIRGNSWGMKKLLVLARIDRGGKRVSRGRIDELVQALGFDNYFETSAKEGTNIAALADAINHAIDWELLPKVTSTELFQGIKAFLITEKQAGRLLSTVDALYRTFLKTWSPLEKEKDFSAEFATGIRLIQSAGLIRQLSFGTLVLLQPELLDNYAYALVNAVRDEPDGLGNILEEIVLAGNFSIPTDKRMADHEQEKLLLIAMVEDLLSYEIALREQGAEGPYLVFPSESTRENPAMPNPENASVVFTFEGPVHNIYATLAVRLSHSDLFIKKDLWKNAITYTVKVGGMCGILLKMVEEGQGELTLFFDEHTSEETRFNFEEYLQVHLQRKALPDTIKRCRIFKCGTCDLPASDQLVRMRIERGFNWYDCPVCGKRVQLLDREERLKSVSPSRIPEMDRAADVKRDRAKARTTVQGKQETSDFDVFLCHNGRDKLKVKEVGEQLKQHGILPWLDEWELRPGLPWQRLLEEQIEHIKSAAAFVGEVGIGPWQQEELDAFLREFTKRGCPVIPVLLPNAPEEVILPPFLTGRTWVDFRKQDTDPMERLIWGITGRRNSLR